MAAVRRPIVAALTLRLASCDRKAATVAGDAGSVPNWRSAHHARKIAKSVPYARRVAPAFSALAKPRARSASAAGIVAGIAATGEPWETVRAIDISSPILITGQQRYHDL